MLAIYYDAERASFRTCRWRGGDLSINLTRVPWGRHLLKAARRLGRMRSWADGHLIPPGVAPLVNKAQGYVARFGSACRKRGILTVWGGGGVGKLCLFTYLKRLNPLREFLNMSSKLQRPRMDVYYENSVPYPSHSY